MKRYDLFKVAGCIVSVGLVLSLARSNAGDLMNINFLVSQALQNDTCLTQNKRALEDELYGASRVSKAASGLSVLSEVLYAGSVGVHGAGAALNSVLLAGGLGITSTVMSEVNEAKSARNVRKLMKQNHHRQELLTQTIRADYLALKNGSTAARQELVTLTGLESVQEVESEINMAKAYQHHLASPADTVINPDNTKPPNLTPLAKLPLNTSADRNRDNGSTHLNISHINSDTQDNDDDDDDDQSD